MTEASKIKVLFFLRRIGPYHHARFNHAVDFVDLTVAETRPASLEYPWAFEAQGRKYVAEKFPVSSQPERGLKDEPLKVLIISLIIRYKPDVIVTTGWADHEYHAIILAAADKKIPRVVISDSRYEDEPRKPLKEWIKKLILRSFSAALVAGTSARQYLIRLGVEPTSIFQAWDVVDNKYFSRQSRSGPAPFDSRYFLCVSRLLPKKNLPRLLDAFATYKASGGQRPLYILGSGEMENAIRVQVQRLGLESSVNLKGFIQYEQLPVYLSSALCLILPSTSDQWGLVVNEAMSVGLPVLVSKQCGCAIDLVKEKENGCIFDAYSENAITDAMKYMDKLGEKDWQRMAETSRTIISNWDLKAFSEGLFNASKKAVDNPVKGIVRTLHYFLAQ